MQLFGVKEFKKHGENVLGSVVTGQGRKCTDDLASRAMNGRNEDQK